MQWQKLWGYIRARLAERSTWRGVVALLAAGGWAVSPEQVEAIAAGAVVLFGVIEAGMPERPERGPGGS